MPLCQQSISQARLSSFITDLNLNDRQYQNAVALLFPLYIAMQVPSNMMLAWCGKPSLYLGTFVCLWGVVSACTAACQNYGQLVTVRVLLGGIEAPFFPGALFLLSKWYTRRELSTRMGLLYAGSIISNAFAGLIAAPVLRDMEGVRGLAAWRWLFIIEGAVTVFVGFCVMYLLPDFPHNTTRFYSEEEKAVAVQRLAEDAGETDIEGENGGAWRGFILCVLDPKVWILTFMLFAAVLGLSFNAFFPTIVKTLGYDRITTLFLTVPIWFWAFICVYLNALHADKTGERFYHITIPLATGMAAFIIGAATNNIPARFFAMFIMASSYAGYVIILSWMSNSIPRPAYKRAVALALINCIANTGNLAGAYIFPSKWGSSYWQSFTICATMFLAAIVLAFVLRLMLIRENKRLDREFGEVEVRPKNISDDEAVESPEERVERARRNFRYLI